MERASKAAPNTTLREPISIVGDQYGNLPYSVTGTISATKRADGTVVANGFTETPKMKVQPGVVAHQPGGMPFPKPLSEYETTLNSGKCGHQN